MQEKNKNKTAQIAVVVVAVTVMMWMFQMNDPYILLLPCISIVWACLYRNFRFSTIDFVLVCICIYDVVNWYMCPSSALDGAYTSVICICCYALLRSTMYSREYRNLFLKMLLFPILIALVITLVSFNLFIDATHEVGFIDTYPLRFLFRPLGYVTTVLSSIYIPLLGLLAIGCYYQIPRWRGLFGLSGVLALVTIFLSFSRAAYIACIVYAIFILIVVKSTRKKMTLLALYFCICGTIWLFFPIEVATTLAMNKTISQRQSTEGRLKATEKALEIFKENKWIGTGDKSYSLTMDKVMTQDSTFAFTPYAPNIAIQLLIEKGIIGIMLYVCLAIAVIITFMRWRKRPIALLSGGCLLAFAIKEMTISSMLNDYVVCLLVFILLAFLQVEAEEVENKKIIVPSWERYAFVVFTGMCFICFETSNLKEQSDKENTHKAVEAFGSGNYLKAVEWLEKTSDRLPCRINRAMLAVNVPDSLLPVGYQLKAGESLGEITLPSDIYISYIQAKLMLNGAREIEAYHILEKLVMNYPRNASYMYEFYQMLYKKGKQQEAALTLAKVLWLYPRFLHTEQVKDVFFTDPIFREKVLANLTLELIKIENTPNAYARYGYISYYMGEKEEAKVFLNKALEFQPGFAVPWLLLGKLHKEVGKTKEAEVCYKKYNILMKGVYTNDKLPLEDEVQIYLDSKVVFERYAKKFLTWYGCALVY